MNEKIQTPYSKISLIKMKDGGYPHDKHFSIIVHTNNVESAKKTINFIINNRLKYDENTIT